MLANVLIGAYAAGLIELYTQPLPFILDISATPLASPLARLQLRDGPIITNLRHTSVHMDDERGRALLALLDGTRDHAALRGELLVRDEELQRDLAKMARLALLIA